jgi:ABC-type branched-subunit amino acid transport system substrate-binding protein
MKKTFITILILIVVAIAGFYVISNKPSEKIIKIGIVATLEGPGALFGKSAVKSIELAQKELGSTKNKYQIIVEDDGGNAGKSASAAQKLINIDKVDAIISVSSLAGNAVKPIAEEAGIPHISNSSDLSIADTKTGFVLSVLPDDEAEAWLKEAKNQNVKTVVILSQNHPGVNLTMEYIVKSASSYGIEIVHQEKFDGQTRDFKTSIAKAKVYNPDLYMLAMFPPLLEIAGKELMDQGQTNISSYAMFGASTDPKMFEGKWYTDTFLKDMNFVARFSQNFPEIRFVARTAPASYDIINLLIKGFESDKDIMTFLNTQAEFSGQSGELKQEKDSHVFRVPVGIWKIENGQSVIVK